MLGMAGGGGLSRVAEAWLRIGAAAAAAALLVVSTTLGATLYAAPLVPLFAAVLAHSASVPLALFRPRVAAPLSAVATTAVMLIASGGTAPWPFAVTTIVTQALVVGLLGYRMRWVAGAGALAAAVVAAVVIAMVVPTGRDEEAEAFGVVLFATTAGALLAAGIVVRRWRSIRAQLVRERRITEEERTRRLVAEEKTRIARELHDVIAHSMSLITVQATSAPFRHPSTDDAVRAEFDDIARSSRRALHEMRSLLGVLRDPDAPLPHAPEPRLSDVRGLIDTSRQSGVDIVLAGEDALVDDGVDELTGLAAFRIIQEAVSNAIRHAPGAALEIVVRRRDGLDIAVRSGAGATALAGAGGVDTAPTAAVVAGTGLIGMRERAAGVGGSVVAGPHRDGGYLVHALLPLQPALS
jgi:signal transduction histidine kinase